jgi:hypothetical protein
MNQKSQMQTANDICSCRGCGVSSSVKVVPELKVNKWKCANCNLVQVWVPSAGYLASGGTADFGKVKRALASQGSLFSAGPFVGLGHDGCVSGVYDNPANFQLVLIVAAIVVVVAFSIVYYKESKGNASE